jgi:hypothetical protein
MADSTHLPRIGERGIACLGKETQSSEDLKKFRGKRER